MSDPNLSSFLWSVADLLRGDYKQSEYGKVILPFTVLRRLDCVLEGTKEKVLAEKTKRETAGLNPEPFLLRASGQLFYNTSLLDLKKLMGDQSNIGENLRAYLQAFSPAVRDIFESFEFHTQIDKLAKAGLLYLITEKFANIDLHPEVVSNAQMGAVFEELIRKFAELSNETAGEHFTPREVIRLMVNLLFIEDDDALSKPGVVRSLYDPTAGTGGMLSVAGEHLAEINPEARLVMYGQELNPESYAICKADMLIKGQDIANIIFGNTLTSDKLETVPRTTFAVESLLERRDLQRLLRRDITPIGDDLMVIAEEYGDWEDSNRRIDLLCLSKSAGLVVVEIKRTEDGGHMELQAIRYASMVSSMTLEQVIQAYARTRSGEVDAARSEVLNFLQLDSTDEAELTGEVRIILVSANFSTELTTAVLWLNKRELDITCVRLQPYKMGNEVLIDATQIIPLPEASDYEVKVRAQEKEKRKVEGVRQEVFRKFWAQLIERSKPRTQLLANRKTTTDHWLSAGIGRTGFSLNTTLVQTEGQVECYIRLPGGEAESAAAFQALRNQKEEIERSFGGELDWQDLPGRQGCRIAKELPGGWKSPEAEWPAMQDRIIDSLIRLEAALKKPIQELKI